MKTITLYRPVAYAELALIEESGWERFPPRLPEQPFFYPVMNEAYATQITVEWNVPAYGVGYVTRFEVEENYLSKYEVQNVGGELHDELWIPAEDLQNFNAHIVGKIEVIAKYE